MKKIITFATLAAFCFATLTACMGPTPTETTAAFFEGIKNNDSEAIAANYCEDFYEVPYANDEGDSATPIDEAYGILHDKLLEFDYEITNEVIDGDTATVDVTITTYPANDAYNSGLDQYFSEGLSLALSGASDEDIEAFLAETLTGKFETMEKNYTGTTTISLTKTNGAWVVDQLWPGSEFYSLITGGMANVTETPEES